ncbi:AraC family transcriptional regulator [Niabella yanshanensis]|nr:AraC family transcriptional regulator [Niabella yanshanensis]
MIKKVLKYSFSLLHVDHVRLNTQWNYKNVISPYYRIYYIDEGVGLIQTHHGAVELLPGHLYMIPSYTLCNLECKDQLSQYFIQFFEDSADGISLFSGKRAVIQRKAEPVDILNIQRLLEINPGRGINRSDNPRVYEKSLYYREYQQLNNHQLPNRYLETQGILLQLVARFLEASNPQKNPLPLPSVIMDTVSYIQLHLQNPLGLQLLAGRVNLHPDYFSRLFKEYMGERPIPFIQEKRIERAQYLIITDDMPLEAIARQTGFDNLSYFIKIFKRITNLTPGQYRTQHKIG